jgi:NAD(P)-dependent dehydrogenase (short-subunit alcohol dehydrogenase family)
VTGAGGKAKASWLQNFAGKTAVVTGAAGGMGLDIARDLSAAGARVTGIDLQPRPDGFSGWVQGDVGDDATLVRAMAQTFERDGRLDCLVNAAGVLWFDRDRSLLDIELEVWERVIRINLTGCMLAARHAIPLMQNSGGGAMVHISSTQCLRGDPAPQDAYQVSKAGLLALSKSIAVQFARDGIRSNVLLPGAAESPMQARWQADPALKARTAAGVPLGRVGTTQDMADACLFLLSDRASFITGTELLVDGGRMALP